jgi:nucleoside-diphosphate-sugar epimerase
MHVLITGGGGFIGSQLVESQLRRGNRVRVVDLQAERLARLADHRNLEIIVGDIADAGLVAAITEGIDVVYHLASAHLEIGLPARRYREINITATENMLRAARAAEVGRVVHCSSVGVLGDIIRLPANEDTPCRPTNVYETTKLAGERLALAFSSRARVPLVVARPAWVYGPGCPRTRKLFRAIQKRRFIMVGDGRTLRQPLYVMDVVAGLERCAEAADAPGRVYILAGPTAVTVERLVERVAAVVGAPPPRLRLPVLPAKAAGLALEAAFAAIRRQPPFSRRSVDFFVKHNAYDTRRARDELGFQPAVGLDEGLERTWESLSSRATEGQPAGAPASAAGPG